MKRHFFISMVLLISISCGVNNRIVELNDDFKEVKSLRLLQSLNAFSSYKTGSSEMYQSFPFSSVYLYEEKGEKQASIILEIKLTCSVEYEGLDSIFFLSLNEEVVKLRSENLRQFQFEIASTSETTESNTTIEKKPENKEKENKSAENIKTVSKQTSTTTKNNYQTIVQHIFIPENIWVSIANSSKIKYRIYLGKMGVDVKPGNLEMLKISEFFNKAIERKAALLKDTPIDQMKW